MNESEALAALYQGLVLEHGRRPRNAALPAAPHGCAERDNPFCGDRVAMGVRLEGGVITEVGFEADGCVISVAAASLLCEAVQRASATEARALCERYLELIAARAQAWPPELGALAAFARVAMFPARTPCATLAISTFLDALARSASATAVPNPR